MTGRQVWQGFLDWLRPTGREADVPAHALVSIPTGTPRVESGTLARFGLKPEGARGIVAAEEAREIDHEELADFLAADHDPVEADPAFRDQLQDDLWALVEKGTFTRPPDH